MKVYQGTDAEEIRDELDVIIEQFQTAIDNTTLNMEIFRNKIRETCESLVILRSLLGPLDSWQVQMLSGEDEEE